MSSSRKPSKPSMKVTRRGQVTIPKFIRQRTGIDEGTRVTFRESGGQIVIERVRAPSPFEKWYGKLGEPGDSDDLVRKMRGHHDG